MKKTAFIFALLTVMICSGQKMKAYEFQFNVKKWNKTFNKQKSSGSKEQVNILLYDVYGTQTLFQVAEKMMTEEKISGIKFLKGTSEDGKKIIALTVMPKTLNGSYLENGVQYFIKAVSGKCNTYKVYVNPAVNIQTGQEIDFIR